MNKTILTFGLMSGVVASVLMGITMPFSDQLGHGYGALALGYASIVLAFLLVYFGIRSYRDNVSGGQISFGRAFAVGISITLISCAFYVATWEVIYFNFMHGFMDNYGSHVLEQLKASGASAAAIQAKAEQLRKTKELYENPLYNAAMTIMEPFPVGLVMTLISAAMLRKRVRPVAVGAVTA